MNVGNLFAGPLGTFKGRAGCGAPVARRCYSPQAARAAVNEAL